MARFVVERTFPEPLQLPANPDGASAIEGFVGNNTELGVTWVHSYVTDDKRHSYCVYDGPDAEAVRKASARNGFPVDRVTTVSVLDPYFYH